MEVTPALGRPASPRARRRARAGYCSRQHQPGAYTNPSHKIYKSQGLATRRVKGPHGHPRGGGSSIRVCCPGLGWWAPAESRSWLVGGPRDPPCRADGPFAGPRARVEIRTSSPCQFISLITKAGELHRTEVRTVFPWHRRLARVLVSLPRPAAADRTWMSPGGSRPKPDINLNSAYPSYQSVPVTRIRVV
jgi:hypothetical protein